MSEDSKYLGNKCYSWNIKVLQCKEKFIALYTVNKLGKFLREFWNLVCDVQYWHVKRSLHVTFILTTALLDSSANYTPRFCCLVDRRCQTFFWTSWWFYHCLPSVKSAHNPVGYLSLASRDHRHVDPIRKRVQSGEKCIFMIWTGTWLCDAIC